MSIWHTHDEETDELLARSRPPGKPPHSQIQRPSTATNVNTRLFRYDMYYAPAARHMFCRLLEFCLSPTNAVEFCDDRCTKRVRMRRAPPVTILSRENDRDIGFISVDLT